MKRFCFWACVSIALAISSCSPQNTTPASQENSYCATDQLVTNAGSQGIAEVFVIDPISSSRNPRLSPSSSSLDAFRAPVTLSHLNGEGILKGKYIEIRNRLYCEDRFGAFDASNHFSYSHKDQRFQEAMAYYYGDIYQESLNKSGYLITQSPIRIVVHCDYQDNAYFAHGYDTAGNLVQEICLGDSVSTPGASYADDAVVTIHELQHSTTLDNYSTSHLLNQFWYDEAGALNEAISDFMSLMFTDSLLPKDTSLDLRIFSRWALGTFDPKSSRLRGAHRCPQYDSSYPNCKNFPGFGLTNNESTIETKISYFYPDGVGWTYSDRFGGENSAKQTFLKSSSQEEIHNAGVLMVGALWDIYSSIQESHSHQLKTVDHLVTKLILETVRNLPTPNSSLNHSPVTFTQFSNQLLETMERIPDFTSSDLASTRQMLKERGLIDVPQLTSGWMAIGPGSNFRIHKTPSPGLYIVDNPDILKGWVNRMFDLPDTSFLNPNASTHHNGQIEPGEAAAIWFDIQNIQDVTAGGVLVTVTSTDPDLSILRNSVNIGYMTLSGTNSTQIMYGKINGNGIINNLNNSNEEVNIPTRNTYFNTNPYFNSSWKTAVWVKASSTAPHGKVVSLHVRATPSNGAEDSIDFPIEIH